MRSNRSILTSAPGIHHGYQKTLTKTVNKKLKKLLKYTMSTISKMQQQQHAIRQQILGPNSSVPMTNGFRLNLRRPVGGGRNGLLFGSFLPRPTGCCCALSTGQIWTLIKHFPICSCMTARRQGNNTGDRTMNKHQQHGDAFIPLLLRFSRLVGSVHISVRRV